MSWVAENPKPVIDKLDQVNTKQNDLVKVLFYLINFGFHGGLDKRMIFP